MGDFFNDSTPQRNQTASTSMGHSSGTQQLYPPNSRTQPRAQAGAGNNFANNMNMDTLYQPVNMFGVEVKMYVLLIIAAIAFYVWGLPGVIAIGVAYWISKSFQEQAPAQQIPQNNEQDQGFQRINRNVAPSAPLRSSMPSDRFPGKAKTLA